MVSYATNILIQFETENMNKQAGTKLHQAQAKVEVRGKVVVGNEIAYKA